MSDTAHDRLDSIVSDSPDSPDSVRTDSRPAVDQESGLRIENNRREAPELDQSREVPLWDRDDAPKGSTDSSLLKYENGVPVRVSGPTHFSHLANGKIVGSYGIGTHHDDGKGPVPVVAHYAG